MAAGALALGGLKAALGEQIICLIGTNPRHIEINISLGKPWKTWAKDKEAILSGGYWLAEIAIFQGFPETRGKITHLVSSGKMQARYWHGFSLLNR